MTDRENKGRTARGERARSKLTDEDVLSIRDKYNRGETQLALAAEYGVRQSNIWYIVNGLTWSHLL